MSMVSPDSVGYDRGTYRIRVDWNSMMYILGIGSNGSVTLNPRVFEDTIYGKSLSYQEIGFVAANVLVHETVHSIYAHSSFTRTGLEHESSGLMTGPPFKWKTFSIDDAKKGMLPFSATTTRRLEQAVGKRF